jgi:hypothetical protein
MVLSLSDIMVSLVALLLPWRRDDVDRRHLLCGDLFQFIVQLSSCRKV